MDQAIQQIDNLTEKPYPLVYFETLRGPHVVDLFKSLSLVCSKAIYHWTPMNGMYRMDASHILIPRTQEPHHVLESILSTPHFGVYLLSGFEENLKDYRSMNLLKKIISDYKNTQRMLIMVGNNIEIPLELRTSIAHIRHQVKPTATNATRKVS